MTDILGPASSLNAVSSRPSDGRFFGSTDTWFRDCTTPASQDGTQVAAAWLNQVMGLFRAVIRGNGLKADGVNPVVAQDQSDNMLLSSINQLIQRGQATYGADTGTADALALAPVGANVAEYKAGMAFLIRKGTAANATTAPTLNVNGLGPVPIVGRTGAAIAAGDLPAGVGFAAWYDGAKFRLLDLTASDVEAIVAASQQQPDSATVLGPGSSTVGNLALFANGNGNLLGDSGISAADLLAQLDFAFCLPFALRG